MDIETEKLRHSAAHVLAMAVLRIFPDAKMGIGPVTEDGFYYDFQFPQPITWEEVKRIESQMQQIIQEDHAFNQMYVPKDQAFAILLSRGQMFKSELLHDVDEYEISFFKTGEEFIDLCRGPHIPATSHIGAIKLTNLSESHWRNDETRPKLQRISGIAFPTAEEMQQHLDRIEHIRQRDFRKLAKNLQLTLGGTENVVYTAHGATVLTELSKVVSTELKRADYQYVTGYPVHDLDEAESIYDLLFSSKNRSYKELPVRFYSQDRVELRSPYRIINKEINSISYFNFKSFILPSEFREEFREVFKMMQLVFKQLELDFEVEMHTPALDLAVVGEISDITQRANISQTQILEADRNTVRLSFQAVDTLGRKVQIAQVEIKLNDVPYINRQGEFAPSSSISGTIVLEELIAFLLEGTNGELPAWLSPIQAVLIPISEKQWEFADGIRDLLELGNLRTQVDKRAESMQAKIRDAEMNKVPFIVIIGEKEQQTNGASLRLRNNQEIGLVGTDLLLTEIQKNLEQA